MILPNNALPKNILTKSRLCRHTIVPPCVKFIFKKLGKQTICAIQFVEIMDMDPYIEIRVKND